MILQVTLVGSCLADTKPPTRLSLLSSLRRHSPRAYHATRSYLWTEDSLFGALSPCPAPGRGLYAFTAALSCGGNADDTRVALMLLLDLTAAVPDIAAVAVEEEREAGEGEGEGEGEEGVDNADAVLVEIADAVESTADVLAARLARWGVGPRDYHRALVGRAVLCSGALHVVPAHCAPALRTRADGPLALLAMGPARRLACREADLTAALLAWADGVARVMREASWHFAVAAVPEGVARLLRAHFGIERAALLHHCVRCPLRGATGAAEAIAAEFRTLAQSRRYVRVPLRLPRYIFAHLFFASRTSGAAEVKEDKEEEEEDKEELRIGLQLTIALHRLRREVHGPHAVAVEEFLQSSARHGDVEVPAGNFFAQDADRGLERLRRELMPCAAQRGASTEWMAAYAQEAAMEHEVTGEELTALDEAMLYHSSDSSTTTVSEDDDDDDEEEEEGAEDVEGQMEVVDALLAERVREELLGGNDTGTAFGQVAENFLFRETVKMLSSDCSV